MIKLLRSLNVFFYSNNLEHHYKESNKLLWIVCNIGFRMVWLIFFYYMKLRGAFRILPPQPISTNSDLIVSLTTFPARIKDVWMVVDSMMRQTIRPSLICLYLSEEEFPDKDRNLPSILQRYKRLGLQIHWVSGNLKPHQKYFYALQAYPDKCVVTIDDDVYYHPDILEHLWALHEKYPNAVCANRTSGILDQDMAVKPYYLWGHNSITAPGFSFNYLATGVGGVLYPKGVMRQKDLFDVEVLTRCCLRADDLWLKCHEILARVPVATGDSMPPSIEINGSQRVSLRSTNCGTEADNGNDVQWRNLDREYDINQKLITLVKNEKQ